MRSCLQTQEAGSDANFVLYNQHTEERGETGIEFYSDLSNVGGGEKNYTAQLSEVVGTPRLLIIAEYKMWVLTEPLSSNTCKLTIGIDYDLSPAGLWRLIGRLFAGRYSDWRLTRMVEGTNEDLEAPAT